MKDILLIGGPTTLTGVDRIDDDLLSILAEDNLRSRKAVIVWPTLAFLMVPDNPDSLQPHIDMNAVIWSVIEEKGMMPSSGVTQAQMLDLTVEACHDKVALDASVIHSAMSEVIYQLSRLMLDITGGLKLAVVMGNDAPVHSLCWTGLVDCWNSNSDVAVKRYNTNSPAYGPLNSVKEWKLEFGCLNPGSHKVEDLMPTGEIHLFGHTISVDLDWYNDTPHALSKTVGITYPVKTRSGNAKAV